MPRRVKSRAHGAGSIWEEQRSGYRVWVGQATVAGAQHQRVLGRKRKAGADDGLTRAMAERRLREVRAEVELADQSRTARQGRATATLSAVAERHFAYLLTIMERRERTVEDYRSMLNVHLLPFFSDVDVEEIDRENVEALMAHMVEEGSAHTTMLNVVNLLHAVLGEALRDALVPVNAAAQARRPPSPRPNKKIHYLKPEEVDALIRAAPDDDLGRVERVLYLTAAWTGLRQGELLALRWKNVDFPSRCVRVHESFSDGRLTDPKSFRSNRRVPMIRAVAEALAREGTRDLWTGDEDLVFAHPYKGTHLSGSYVSARCKKALERAGLRTGTRFHDLRHTFGTQMATGGRPIAQIQAWMGHANIQTTEVYAQWAPDPSGGVDLAEQAYDEVTRRDNCQMTDTESVRVA